MPIMTEKEAELHKSYFKGILEMMGDAATDPKDLEVKNIEIQNRMNTLERRYKTTDAIEKDILLVGDILERYKTIKKQLESILAKVSSSSKSAPTYGFIPRVSPLLSTIDKLSEEVKNYKSSNKINKEYEVKLRQKIHDCTQKADELGTDEPWKIAVKAASADLKKLYESEFATTASPASEFDQEALVKFVIQLVNFVGEADNPKKQKNMIEIYFTEKARKEAFINLNNYFMNVEGKEEAVWNKESITNAFKAFNVETIKIPRTGKQQTVEAFLEEQFENIDEAKLNDVVKNVLVIISPPSASMKLR